MTTAGLCLATATWGETTAPFVDFTFKRVKVPTSTTAKRITVQIDPNVEPYRFAMPSRPNQPIPGPAAPYAGDYDWYWAAVSPQLADASPGRLEDAVNKLTNGPEGKGVPTPRLQDLQKIADMHGKEILKATIGTRVSPALVLAVIGIESGGRTAAVSSAGATGLMQLMPATAERFGVDDTKIAADNIQGGVAYLDWLMKEFGGDPVMVLASYNAGENAVKKHNGVPPFAETRAYVPKVLAAWSVARGLCLTPPQLMSDGCVFSVRQARNDG
ncbi:MAG: lytic transglycosylase domain-containing protein [Paracoccaceae bacterium]